jgi:hypothetical protein
MWFRLQRIIVFWFWIGESIYFDGFGCWTGVFWVELKASVELLK